MKVVCQNKICTFYQNDRCTRKEIVLNELGVCGSYITTLKLPEEEVGIKRTPEEIRRIEDEILMAEKSLLSDRLYIMEDENSLSLSAGCCTLCTGCTRPSGKECRHADKMRYSLESLGANVGLTCSKLLGVTLEWVAENHLRHQICLISGLLK